MDKQYPIGQFQFDGDITKNVINRWVNEIEELPRLLRDTVKDLDKGHLDIPYRSGGWTVRQVIHHLADSHMNAYVRFKLALTEHKPVIKPYTEARWAELSDSKLPIDLSIDLLESLHKRWVYLFRNLSAADLERTFSHPDLGEVSIGENIGIYAWHGRIISHISI
ncbi:YfiT family bacillithiol transferase [Mesobacillus harenae]|uniref:YfiT family bacillithiol transferase n=1 Tax=Mesobacillus harenae TaxID=2213203 RepID=UPI00157FCAAD